MGLVDYSDSDGSDIEEKPTPKPSTSTSSSKAAFQKVVDRSNPGKIKVSLPQSTIKDDTKVDEPPAKRVKIGSGAFSGFNSFLPAPKRSGQTSATLGGGNATKRSLGAGVNLKTGAAPGFSRDPEPEREYNGKETEAVGTDADSGMQLPPPQAVVKQQEEVQLVGKPLMFRPLSVSRKPAKKKKLQANTPALTSSSIQADPATPDPNHEKPGRAKISLFSMAADNETDIGKKPAGEYQPMIYEADKEEEEPDEFGLEPSYEDYTSNTSQSLPAAPTPPVSQSLDDIAGDLNLTAAQRRQLFGRQKGGQNQSASKIINFNTDQEYLHNEELRASGQQVTHNPVRAIAPGKHSLKQLLNAAQSQKEALEESFNKGKSNRAEASSRYGW